VTRLYTNNAATTLASGLSAGATTLTVVDGSVFPTPVSPDYFTVTITQAGAETSWEEVKVTARSGNTLTIVRGQEGTTDATWASGDKVEIRFTALAAADAANTGYSGSAVLDFGAAPGGNFAQTTIYGQTDIKGSAQAQAWLMAADSTDHNAMEHLLSQITVMVGNIVPGASFDIMGYSPMRLTGQWVVEWARTR